MSMLYLSENESQSIGLKIGRAGRRTNIETLALWKDIQSQQFDWVKLKTELSDRAVFSDLDQLPCFIEPFNIIALQKAVPQFAALPHDCEISFELYDGIQAPEVRNTLLDILSEDTNLYYQSDIYDALMPKGAQTERSLEYYLSMNHQVHSDRFLFIGRNREGEAVGVCSFMKTSGAEAEGVIYGVRPAFRSQQYAGIFLQQSINTLAEAGIQAFFTEVQYYNFRSLYPHLKSGFKPAGLYANLNLFPFLSSGIEQFSCRGKNIQEALNERIRSRQSAGVRLEWAGVRGDTALLFSEEALQLSLLLCTPQLSLAMAKAGPRICYFKISHQYD